MKHSLFALVFIGLTLFGQATAATPPDDNLNATAWSQTSIEHNLILLQTYKTAENQLIAALNDPHWNALTPDERTNMPAAAKPAIILDVDETVLDNSPFQAFLMKNQRTFNEADWGEWCRKSQARALPGALAFVQLADRLGIDVFYISNRAKDLDTATIQNLKEQGFPIRGTVQFLGLGTVVPHCESVGSEKGCRRILVGRTHRVLMQFGDQLGDFMDVLNNTVSARNAMVTPYINWVGQRWFVLPNPMYGSWEAALINNNWAESPERQRQQKMDALSDR
ncbi:MAG: acid phosphatase [Halothiobacillus sp. 20-53-49]|nr:MAG: acid phosphatase [Halothiobacillus sp. 20-53-49]